MSLAFKIGLFLLCFCQTALCCTSIRISTQNKEAIYGRTMEFAEELLSSIIFVPQDIAYQGTTQPDVKNGIQWKVKYPFTGVSAYHMPHVVDGINTQGLAIGLLYFPNYAKYPDVNKKNQSQGLAPWEFGTYVLSNFANIDEVKKGLNHVTVLAVPFKKEGKPPQYHYVVHDASGKSLVIEYLDGKLHTYDNPLGVLTNSPTFDWHMTNLRNYVNLTVNNVPPVNVDGTEFIGLGQGTGLLGLPGDFTPPSRFVRAVAFSQASVPSINGEEGVFHVFHIMNQFDIPKGAIRNTDNGKTQIEYTQWTSASNLKNKKYYYRTYTHPQIHMIDLMKMDPHAKNIQWYPMSKDVNSIEEIKDFSDKIY